MDTSATVFGISADDARFFGKYFAWAWLGAGYYFAHPYTYVILLANMLHFDRGLLDGLGEAMGHEFTVEDINYLGMLAYEYFLGMALSSIFFIFVPLSWLNADWSDMEYEDWDYDYDYDYDDYDYSESYYSYEEEYYSYYDSDDEYYFYELDYYYDDYEDESEWDITGRPWFLILMLMLPWLWLTLEELTAPFITYTPEMLMYMYLAESTVRFYYADDLAWWLTAIGFDALYKYSMYIIYKPPGEIDSFQLGG